MLEDRGQDGLVKNRPGGEKKIVGRASESRGLGGLKDEESTKE